jgi:hypothetical protein
MPGGGAPGGAPGASGAPSKPSSRELGGQGAKPGEGAGKDAKGASERPKREGAAEKSDSKSGGKDGGKGESKKDGGSEKKNDGKGKPQGANDGRSRGEQAARQAGSMAAKEGLSSLTGGASKAVPGADKAAGKVGEVAGTVLYKTPMFMISMAFLVILGLLGVTFASGGTSMAVAPAAAMQSKKLPDGPMKAYRTVVKAFSKDEKYGGEIPWGLIAGLAEMASEHGKLSPYPTDLCDRNPAQPLQRGRVGLTTEACGTTSISSYPEVSPPIGGKADEHQNGVGPFLIQVGALGKDSPVNPQKLSARSAFSTPRTATEYVAYEMDQIRHQMVDKEGKVAPKKGDIAAARAFWGEVLARLPLADPAATACVTPTIAVGSNKEQIGLAISQTWHCELLQQELYLYSTIGVEQRIEQNVQQQLLAEALQVAWSFSNYGTNTLNGCTVSSVQNTDGTTTKTIAVTATDAEPAGVFPLDKKMFDTYAPAGAVLNGRCDAGSNIVAAVRALVAIEAKPWDERDGEQYQKIAGGWNNMPWALGDSETQDVLFENGPFHSFDPTGRDAKCGQAVVRWVDDMYARGAVFQGVETVAVVSAANPDTDGNFVPDVLDTRRAEFDAVVKNLDPRGAKKACGERTDGAVERYAANIALERENQKYYLDGGTGEIGYNGEEAPVDTTPTVDAGDGRILPVDPATAVPSTTVATAPLTPEQLASDSIYRGLNAWMSVLEQANPQGEDTTWRRGIDGSVMRLSVNNRVVTDAPYPVVPAAGYVAQAVIFASVLSPLVEDDPGYREDITVEELEQALNAVLPAEFAGSGGGTVGGAPAVLVDAVQKAVEFGKTKSAFPTCTVDAAILLGVSYTEARGSWKNITSTGDMVPPTLSSERADKTDNDSGVYDGSTTEDYAIGAFQITPGNWIGYRSVYPNADPRNPTTWGGSSVGTDANGDGVADPNNVYDAAVAAWKMICKNAGSRDLITWGDDFIQSFGPYVGGGKWNSRETRTCYNWGEMSWYDCTVILAKAKFDQATMFRVQLSLGASFAGNFPPGFAGAIEWAKSQYGAPYNGGGKYRFGDPWGVEPYPLKSIFPGSSQTYWFPPGTVSYDCSGFITTFFRRAGVNLPSGATSSRGMRDTFPLVAGAAAAQPGDLLISDFDINGQHSGRPSHVVLYIGNNTKVESSGSKGVHESLVQWDKVVWIVRPPMPQA